MDRSAHSNHAVGAVEKPQATNKEDEKTTTVLRKPDSIAHLSDAEVLAQFNESHLSNMKERENEVPEWATTRLKRILLQYKDNFPTGEEEEHSTVHDFEAQIALKPGSIPAQSRIYRTSPKYIDILDDWIKEHEAKGLLVPSDAPWRAGVVCVPKRNGKTRICCDFRKTNLCLKPVSWVMPTVQDLLDSIDGSHWYTALDLVSAYHQIPLKDDGSRERTTFCTTRGCWYWTALPFGIKTASAYFQRFSDMVVGELRYKCALNFQDDCMIHGKTLPQHLDDVEAIMARMYHFNCKLQITKCHFLVNKVMFLGHQVSKEGVAPDPTKVEAINAFKVEKLKTKRDLKVFLHTVGYMRKFIKNFAKIAKPLTKYMKQAVKMPSGLKGDDDAIAAFKELRDRLKTAPILSYPDSNLTYEVHCDGSKRGLGSALAQRGEDGRMRIISYASRSLRGTSTKNPNGGEANYYPYELECLAVVWSLSVFRRHLLGRRFKVYTDHSALRKLPERAVARTERWILQLIEFDFEVIHQPGSKHGLPDGLSRFPIQGNSIYGEEEVPFLSEPTAAHELWRRRTTDDIIAGLRVSPVKRKPFPTSAVTRNQGARAQRGSRAHDSQPSPNAAECSDQQAGRNAPRAPPRQQPQRQPNPLGSNKYPPEPARKLSTRNILREQRDDTKCAKILQALRSGTPMRGAPRERAKGIKRFFFISNGLLMRKHSEPKKPPKGKDHRRSNAVRRRRALDRTLPPGRIVVPQSLRADVLDTFHGIPLTGHLGRKKTTERAATYFWWGGMAAQFRKKVRSCHLCQMRKPPQPTRNLAPGSIQANAPWQLVAIDCVGPLPESNGNVKLLTVVDVFSRYPLAIPVPNEKAETVALALHKHLFSVHGFPKLILSDRAQGFVSKGLIYLCKHLGIAKIETTGLLPRGNSNVERTHASLNAALTMFCNRAKNDWTAQVDAVLFTFRTSVNEATSYSPYFLVHGRHARLPIEVAAGLHDRTMSATGYNFVETITRALQLAYRHVLDLQTTAAKRNQKLQLGLPPGATEEEIEKQLKLWSTPDFQPGDLVSYWEPEGVDKDYAKPKKLQYKYTGPHKILSRDGNHYYIQRRGKKVLANPNRLRRYHTWAYREGQDQPVEEHGGDHPPYVDPDESFRSATDKPEMGDMVVLRLEASEEQPAPFAVGQILAVRDQEEVMLQWYGNSTESWENTFRPGWLESRAAAKRGKRSEQPHHYYAERPRYGNRNAARLYTTDTTITTIKMSHLVCWGFELTHEDRLPLTVRRTLHNDPEIAWTIPLRA
jgi:hypothetical protein